MGRKRIAPSYKPVQCIERGGCRYEEKKVLDRVRSPDDVVKLLPEGFVNLGREAFLTVLLNTRNEILGTFMVSLGTLNASLVHPREVFLQAIRKRAASVILIHNHPSGDSEPSREDLMLTKRLVSAGDILGIDILDHVIVAKGSCISLKARKLM